MRSMSRISTAGLVMAAGLMALLGTPALAQQNTAKAAPTERLTLVVPGAAGGGWDVTARRMQQTLTTEGIVRSVDVVHSPGGSGLLGLSQFVSQHKGKSDALLIGGLVMVGAAIRDEAAVTLRHVRPIARLTGEWGVIAVPNSSELHDARMLRQMMARNPEALRWAGGALGGPDQGLVWAIATKLGVPLDEVPYYGRPGGRRVAESVVAGRHNIGTGGYAEFAPFVTNKQLRILAVAAPNRIAGIAAPTLAESGIDVSMMNWRGVFAPPGLSGAEEEQLLQLMHRMVRTATWREMLKNEKWRDMFLAGRDFENFIEHEERRWPALIDPPQDAALIRSDRTAVRHGWALVGLVAIAPAGLLLGLVMHYRQRPAQTPLPEQQDLDQEQLQPLIEMPKASMKLVKDGIDDDFGEWNLSLAERDVAWFMLRGLPLREIASLRGTSERTVRQQAQSIYRKAGLEGRSDLAGRVLERFI